MRWKWNVYEKQQCSTKPLTQNGMEDGNNSRGIDKYFIVMTNWRNRDE